MRRRTRRRSRRRGTGGRVSRAGRSGERSEHHDGDGLRSETMAPKGATRDKERGSEVSFRADGGELVHNRGWGFDFAPFSPLGPTSPICRPPK